MNSTRISLHKVPKRLKSGKKSVYYVLRWYSQDGTKRYSQSVGRVGHMTKAEAEAARRQKEIDLGSGRTPRDRPPRISLKEFLEQDRKAIQGDVRPATLAEHRHAGIHALKVLGADTPLTCITRADVGRIKAYLSQLGRAPATIRKTLVVLKAAFNRAKADGLIPDNPFTGHKLPSVESREKRIFSSAEIDAMVEASPSLWWKTFIRLAVDTGLRKQELEHLLWRVVDFDAMMLAVVPRKAGRFEVPGGGNFPILRWTAKTKASYRTVPLTPEAASLLQRLRLKSGHSAYVFLDLDRLAALGAKDKAGTLHPRADLVNNLLRDFKAIQGRARALIADRKGVSLNQIDWPVATLHDLRRTWCTRVAAAVPMHVLKELAGHANISTTATFYLTTTASDAEKVRAALSA